MLKNLVYNKLLPLYANTLWRISVESTSVSIGVVSEDGLQWQNIFLLLERVCDLTDSTLAKAIWLLFFASSSSEEAA